LLKKIDGAGMTVGEDVKRSDGQDEPAEAERVNGADLKRDVADLAAAALRPPLSKAGGAAARRWSLAVCWRTRNGRKR
jgi:hypothetical protein